jgi:hypothetical protein
MRMQNLEGTSADIPSSRYRDDLREEVIHNGTQSFINHRLYRHVSDALKAPVDDELRYKLHHQRLSQHFPIIERQN